LGNPKRFKEYFAKPITAARDKDATRFDIELGKKVGAELQAVLRPYLLQRLKKDILADMLPSKQELVVWTHLSDEQRDRYTKFIERGDVVQDILAGVTKSPLAGISWLKKLCGIPLLVDEAVKNDLPSFLSTKGVDDVLHKSAKLEVLAHLVPALIGRDHRILIFSQSTKMLDIIQFVLKSLIGNRIARIDGTTQERSRQRLVDLFNEDGGIFDVMLLSTRAGGVGLTLTGADRVILYDPDWNPALDNQAVDR
jgi:SNF2 family DNA or RNA helicase